MDLRTTMSEVWPCYFATNITSFGLSRK